jgi:hypothetical protein
MVSVIATAVFDHYALIPFFRGGRAPIPLGLEWKVQVCRVRVWSGSDGSKSWRTSPDKTNRE